MENSKATNIVIYDDQCSLCVAQTRLLNRLDWFHAIRFQAISDPHSTQLSLRVQREDLLAAIHCLTKDGRIYRAARCFRFIAMRIPLLAPLALLLWIPGMIWIAERIYNRIARNRYFLSRFFGCKEACEISLARKNG